MTKYFWRKAVFAGLLFLCGVHPLPAAPLTLLTEAYAPYAWTDSDGKVQGISVDIVTQLMRRAEIATTSTRVLPWARAMAITARVPDTCLYSAARTSERENSFKWIGPIGRLEWVFFARTADKITLDSIDQARRYRVGTYVSNGTIPLLQSHGIKVELASSDRSNPIKLQLRRIDLWAVGRTPGVHLLRELKIDGIEPVFELAQSELFLACNLSMPDLQVSHLNKVLRDMFADDTVRHIYTRYGYGAMTPQ